MGKYKNIAIVMCTWKRTVVLHRTLKLLDIQSNKDFDLFIWNNNINKSQEIQDTVKMYNINISIINSKVNVGGIGRFYYARLLYKNYEKIIFIDDDQIFDNNFIKDFNNIYKKKTITSWFAWKLNGSYFNRRRVTSVGDCDYCGTGGMMIDATIFQDEKLFNIPEKYKFVEDLWLSYYAKYVHNYNLFGCAIYMKIIEDNNDQYHNLKKIKEELYTHLEHKYKKHG